MMATETIPDARHEAILSLHRALLAVENGDAHAAENAAHAAIAWLRDMPAREFPHVAAIQALT
jgi:hypothetical protein